MNTLKRLKDLKMKQMKEKKGFTLVELVMVILIIAILAVALVPQLSSMVNKAKGSGVTEDFHEFQTAAQAVLYENSGIPSAGLAVKLNKNLDSANAICASADGVAVGDPVTDATWVGLGKADANAPAFTKTLDPWNKNYKVVTVPALAGTHRGGVAFITGGPNATIGAATLAVDANLAGTMTAASGGAADTDDQATFIIYTEDGSVQVGTCEGTAANP